MNTEHAQVERRFWLWWMLASIVGLAVGLGIMVVMVVFLSAMAVLWSGIEIRAEDMAKFVAGFREVIGLVFGAAVGIPQWLVLRRKVSKSGWWVLASTAGGAVGYTVAYAMVLELDLTMNANAPVGIVLLAGVGASLGIAQWLFLRRQVARAGLWVLASTVVPAVIYFIFFMMIRAVDNVLPGSEYVAGGPVFGGVVGAVFGYGAITGGVMIWLLRQPVAKE